MQGRGTDFLYALYSKEALNIETIRQQLEHTSSNFMEKIKRVLGDKLVEGKTIKFSTSEISFTAAPQTNKTVVALIVKLEHTEP
jgi:predicted transcriptional regulator